MAEVLTKKKSRRSSQIARLGLECTFLKYSDDDSHITYTIQLKCKNDDSAWNISKRYNEFHRLNTELQKDRNFRGIQLPHFPGKAISFTDASKKELAAERMQHLEMYLNGLISRTVFLSSSAVRLFLMMPDGVRDLALQLSTLQSEALKQGYMEKKGELNKKWRRRWFVLQPNYILKYYKEESSSEPQGSIDISNIVQVQMKSASREKKFSFTLVGKDRRWFLACENDTEKREWTRVFMRLRDTKAPAKTDKMMNHGSSGTDLIVGDQKALNLGPHFKTVTQIKWCPTIPGILATGSDDETVKIWQTHLLDHTLVPAECEADEMDKVLKGDGHDGTEQTNDDSKQSESSPKETKQRAKQSTYPLHAIEFQPIAEFKTSGKVTSLEWSPDGSMLVASLMKEMTNKAATGGGGKAPMGYFIQCFDLHPTLGRYTTDWDDFGGDHNEFQPDFDGDTDGTGGGDAAPDDMDESRTKIFTLQDHPARLVFSSNGQQIYMSMDIDPNSEENEKRRPAFLVYLDLGQNQLHRCKTVDRIIDHQTEFIVDLAMNNARNIMVVATSTHSDSGRMIAWDMERNETNIVERKGVRISSLLFTEDDSWLVVGRIDGTLQFWNIFNEQNKKLQSYYQQQKQHGAAKEDDGDAAEEPQDEEATEVAAHSISTFEMKFEETIHSGPVFKTTTSNGVLLSSAKPTNLDYESFFIDNVIWDVRSMQNMGRSPKVVSRMHNLNDTEKDITRLLDLSPVTPRHVREGGGPGTLLAASGDHAVYCHNMMDVVLDALSMGNAQ